MADMTQSEQHKPNNKTWLDVDTLNPLGSIYVASILFIAAGAFLVVFGFYMDVTVEVSVGGYTSDRNVVNLQKLHFSQLLCQSGFCLIVIGFILIGIGMVVNEIKTFRADIYRLVEDRLGAAETEQSTSAPSPEEMGGMRAGERLR